MISFYYMARQCALCGKKSKIVIKRVKLRGKFNPTTKRRQKPNLQYFKLSSKKRVLICTKCRKKLSKELESR